MARRSEMIYGGNRLVVDDPQMISIDAEAGTWFQRVWRGKPSEVVILARLSPEDLTAAIEEVCGREGVEWITPD